MLAALAVAVPVAVGATAHADDVPSAPVDAHTVNQDAFCVNVRVVEVGICGGDEAIVPDIADLLDTARAFRFTP